MAPPWTVYPGEVSPQISAQSKMPSLCLVNSSPTTGAPVTWGRTRQLPGTNLWSITEHHPREIPAHTVEEQGDNLPHTSREQNPEHNGVGSPIGGTPPRKNGRWGGKAQGTTSYIQRRTSHALSQPTSAPRRFQSNPYHGAGPLPINSPITSEGGPTLTPLEKKIGPPAPSPNPKYTWDKSALSTPLNKMPIGTTKRWTHSGAKVSVQLGHPARKFVPTNQSLKRQADDTMTLTPIPECKQATGQYIRNPTPTMIGPGPPTLDMVTLGTRLKTIPAHRLVVNDFIILRTSMGTSVMVALLIEQIRKQYRHPTTVQLQNFAHLLLTTYPEILLEFYQTPELLQQFAREQGHLSQPLPPFTEKDLSPCLIPMAISETRTYAPG